MQGCQVAPRSCDSIRHMRFALFRLLQRSEVFRPVPTTSLQLAPIVELDFAERRDEEQNWSHWAFCLLTIYISANGEISYDQWILSNGSKWQCSMLILFMVIISYVGPVQCFSGADFLRWRSFYATEDNAWRAHYREVFDHGIREALCCVRRVKYLTVLEEDEVCSVAQLLGDLVTYRASGTGHLELLAVKLIVMSARNALGIGFVFYFLELILVPSLNHMKSMVVPMERMHVAAFYHPFAEAAYTGLLLDIGRNPVHFSCSWLYGQGILAPWL
ncbi:hypothetical protein T459_32668 [Capsicum annuum]|uniref:DUF7358 domain-containing protein n=1 Tax=Capsicum annuum TaxID=4072 RepID=A0A2G2Y115_CAPAN|nr:hypothetical protein T459_32668 [Capsicum annuum]